MSRRDMTDNQRAQQTPGRPVSESGGYVMGTETHGRGGCRRRVLVLASLSLSAGVDLASHSSVLNRAGVRDERSTSNQVRRGKLWQTISRRFSMWSNSCSKTVRSIKCSDFYMKAQVIDRHPGRRSKG